MIGTAAKAGNREALTLGLAALAVWSVIWVLPELDRARIRRAVRALGGEVLSIGVSKGTAQDGSALFGYRVSYRDGTGREISQFCRTSVFRGVEWMGDADVPSTQTAENGMRCCECLELMFEYEPKCHKCGWCAAGERRFTIPERREPLPKCLVRLYSEEDFESCSELYLLNEPGRFPPGFHGEFCDSLRDKSTTFFVCEVNGKVVAVAGVRLVPKASAATLFFGLVHPAHHGKGFGSVMLLARLAALPAPRSFWLLFMFNVESSASFYLRFGFAGSWISDANGLELWHFSTAIDSAGLRKCREMLAASGVVTSGVVTSDVDASLFPEHREKLPGAEV